MHKWLPLINNQIDPWLSTADIGKGETWLHSLMKELSKANVGIICLTSENLTQPWLHFEAGALGKALESSLVWPVLVGVDPTAVSGPIANYQMTKGCDKDDMYKLAIALNTRCERPLVESRLALNFEITWEKLRPELKIILEEEGGHSSDVIRSSDDLLSEVLERVRGLSTLSTQLERIEGLLTNHNDDQSGIDEAGELMNLEVGDTVTHDHYGLGVIRRLDGAGTRRTATIDFDGQTIRLMLIRGVPLVKN